MDWPEIPVVAVTGERSGNAEAVFLEIETLLECLLRQGEGGMVDIQGLPLTPADREWLRAELGRGEVDIRMDLAGATRIVETGYPGVWWIEHRDEAGRLVSEFVQVAYLPELIAAHPDDVESGYDQLRSRNTRMT